MSNNTVLDDGRNMPKDDSAPPPYVLFIFGVCLLAAVVRTLNNRWTFLHHTVIMFGFGAMFGYLSKEFASVNKYLNLDFVTSSEMLHMHAFVLPVVILEHVFSMDPRVFLSCSKKAIASAVLDYILTVIFQGSFVFYFLSFYSSTYAWNVKHNTQVALLWLLIGSLTAVTDTTYVVNTFYKMGSFWVVVKLLQIKRIISIVGACVVYIFVVFEEQYGYNCKDCDWNNLFTFIAFQVFAAPVVGWLAAHLTIWWIRRLYNDTAVEMTVALSISYLVYYFGAANISKKPFVSAISVVVYALMLNNQRNCFSLGLDTFLHQLLHIIAYVVKTTVFTMIGFLIAAEDFKGHGPIMFYTEILATFALYAYCMLARAIVGTAVYPFLRLAGWKMSWQEMSTTIFCNVSGTVCIITAIEASHENLTDLFFDDRHIQYTLMFQLGILALIRSIMAGTLFTQVLKVLGMRHVSLSRYVAMSDALKKIQEQMKTAARSYKFDRFLADADWETVYRFTNFEDPYKDISRYSVIGPAMNLDSELLGDTRLNLLHAQKISFWRQYEQGLLSLRALRILLEECNLAEWKVTTDSYDIGDQIRKYYAKKSTGFFGCIEKIKNRFEHEQEVRHTIINEIVNAVKNRRRRIITKIIMSNAAIEALLIIFIIFIAIVSIIVLVYESDCTGAWNVFAMNLFFFELNIAFVATFTVYLALKFVFFKWRYLLLFGSIFNVSLVVVGWIDIGLSGLLLNPEETCAVMMATNYAVTVRLVFHKLFIAHRVLRLGILLEDKTNLLITLMKKSMLVQLQLGYDVGKGYVYCKEDVQEYASEFIPQPEVLKRVQTELKSSRVQMMKELATVQKKFPGIVVSVKSQEACRRILNAANELVTQMRKNGRVDSYEADMLEEMIKLRLKKLAKIPAQIEMPSVDTLISKLPWVDGDEMLLRFLQFNAKLFNMAEGEMVDFDSDPTAGLYILVSGLIRVNWVIGEPYKELVQAVHSGSETTLLSPNKLSIVHDYMTTGSTFGELALLTEAPIFIDAMCETTVLMYHIQYESIRTALDWIKDPPLEWRLWQLAAVRVSFPLLKALPGYFSRMSMENLKVLIDHGTLLVQHLESEFQDSTNKEVVDPGQYLSTVIVLVHGIANTASGEVFVGPIVIPPNSEELVFSSILCDLYVLYLVPQKPIVASVGFTVSASELSTQGLDLSTMKDSGSQQQPSRGTIPRKRGRMSVGATSGHKISELRVTLSLNPPIIHPSATTTPIVGERTEEESQAKSAISRTTADIREDREQKKEEAVEGVMTPRTGMYSPLSFTSDTPFKSASPPKPAGAASPTPVPTSPEKSPKLLPIIDAEKEEAVEGAMTPRTGMYSPLSFKSNKPFKSASPPKPVGAASPTPVPTSPEKSSAVIERRVSLEAPQPLPTTDAEEPSSVGPQSTPDILDVLSLTKLSLPPESPPSQPGWISSTDSPGKSQKSASLPIPEEDTEEPALLTPAPKVSPVSKAPLESKASPFKQPPLQASAAPSEEFLPPSVKPRKATSEVITRPWTDAWKYVAPQIKITFGGFEKYTTVASPIASKRLDSPSTGAVDAKTSNKTDGENSNKNANNATNTTDSERPEKANQENQNNSA